MKTTREESRLPVDAEPVAEVRAVVHRPARPSGPAVLLTHGAGGNLDGEGLVALADGLASLGHLTVRANLPYREAGRKSPPKAERTAGDYVKLLDATRIAFGPRRPWVAGGKSYGGRVASLAVADGMPAAGLLFYGYPLHPPGKTDRLRVEHWPDVQVPCAFLQGTRDALCDLRLLQANLRKLPRRAMVEVVEGGDHSLRVSGNAAPDGTPRSPAEVLTGLAGVVGEWLADL